MDQSKNTRVVDLFHENSVKSLIFDYCLQIEHGDNDSYISHTLTLSATKLGLIDRLIVIVLRMINS